MADIHEVELTVADKAIHCAGCEGRIEMVLGRVAGVHRVKADYKRQTVRVTADFDKVALDMLKKRLEDAGYRTG